MTLGRDFILSASQFLHWANGGTITSLIGVKTLYHSLSQPYKLGAVIISILWMEQLRLTEGKSLSLGEA